mgnify:CR=1 FL=1
MKINSIQQLTTDMNCYMLFIEKEGKNEVDYKSFFHAADL